MHTYIITGLLPFALLAGGCKTTQQKTAASQATTEKSYTYSDGSGNSYLVTKDSFEYIPVKPAESSTGRYDGGYPVKNQTDPELFNKLGDLVRAAYAEKNEHNPNREKGTARIGILEGSQSTVFILKMNSMWITNIEAILTKMKAGK